MHGRLAIRSRALEFHRELARQSDEVRKHECGEQFTIGGSHRDAAFCVMAKSSARKKGCRQVQ